MYWIGGYHVKRSMALDMKIKYGPVAQLAERQTHCVRKLAVGTEE